MNMRKLVLLGAAFAGLAACAEDQSEPVSGGVGVELPAGFEATIFADALGRTRHIAVRENGDVYVAVRADEGAAGGLIALRDTDGDGRADQIERFGPQDVNTGLTIFDGILYFSSTTSVYAVPLEADRLVPRGAPELVVGGFPEQRSHSAKPVTFDPEGYLYVNSGAPSNACQEQTRTPGSPGQMPCPQLVRSGGVWRVVGRLRGQDQITDGVRFSTGHRQVVALEWNPVVNELFLVMHGRDQLDELWPALYTPEDRVELPAEEFHVVRQGDNFGWPYTYYDPIRNQRMIGPEYGGDGETPAERGRFKDPLIGFPAHWAPNDLLFYSGEQFPERYYGGAFIAFHGSWNRQPDVQGGYNVVFVPMQNGRPAGEWEVFARGFAGPEPVTSPAEAAHRPTGLAQGPDGALYITDDAGGRIWKVSYRGG